MAGQCGQKSLFSQHFRQRKIVVKDGDNIQAPKHPLLDSIGNSFAQISNDRDSNPSIKNASLKTLQRGIASSIATSSRFNNLPASSSGSFTIQSNSEDSSPAFKDSECFIRNNLERGVMYKNKWSFSPVNETLSLNAVSSVTELVGYDSFNVDANYDETKEAYTILDYSNNSADSSAKSNEAMQSKMTRVRPMHACPVLHCDAEFSSVASLGQHMNNFEHSPLNPCRRAIDARLPTEPLCYMCIDCDAEFELKDECFLHMMSENHFPYFPPLSIAGYLCSQCLLIFESFESCWRHMEQSSHHDICYPFKEDHTSELGALGPVPIAQELVHDFVKKCKDAAFTVQCLDCSVLIENSKLLRDHRKHCEDHVLCSLTESSQIEIFSGYLSSFSCDVCHRLFNGELKEASKHQCAKGVIGTVTENDTASFVEFIKRCTLTLIKSLEPSNTTGPSHHSKQNRYKGCYSNDVNDTVTYVKTCASVKMDRNSKRNAVLLQNFGESDGISGLCSQMDGGGTSVCLDDLPPNYGAKRMILRQSAYKQDANDHVPQATKSIKSLHRKECSSTIISAQQYCTESEADKSCFSMSTSSGIDKTCSSIIASPCVFKNFAAAACMPISNVLSNGNLFCTILSAPYQITKLGPSSFKYQFRNHSRISPSLSNVDNSIMPNPIEINDESIDKSCSERDDSLSRVQFIQPGYSSCGQSSSEMLDNHQETSIARRDHSHSPNKSAISTDNLICMRNIIFLDLDNWPSFFTKLPRCLPDQTFVWGFFGGKIEWREPYNCYVFNQMKKKGLFYLNEQCGSTKDAADFAIVLSVGKMDERLPTHIAFTIMSGDKGFCEVERQMRNSDRKAVVINPHSAHQFSYDMIYAMVTSITDT